MCLNLKRHVKNTQIICTIVALILLQLDCAVAKHYKQPYGDIMTQEEENVYPSSFDAATTGPNSYEQRSRTSLGRRRGEWEKGQYQNLDNPYYNRNNRNFGGTSANSWPVAARIEELQQDNNTDNRFEDPGRNKCSILVPLDALDKYPEAERKQTDRNAGLVRIEVCCKGYAAMRWQGRTLCRPVCENCQNGRCIAPGKCECYDEYVATDNGDCVFTCPLGCLNGRCYLDGSCECEAGFKLDESRKFCRPICSKGCGTSRLHNCTEPEVCGCIKGYILTDNDCQPVCQHDCGNGGICRYPDICECTPGFELKDGVCQADCYQKCDNGICFSRNRCICNPGFTYHERSTQCIPK